VGGVSVAAVLAGERRWFIAVGDVIERLREIPDNSVHVCVTSPPYWGLRDYGTATWDGGDADCQHTHNNPDRDKSGRDYTGTRGELGSSGARARPMKGLCGKCGARRIDQQIGLEDTPAEFIARMVEVFAEVWRVLHPTGTLWLNLGDSYAGSWGAQSRPGYTDESSTLEGRGKHYLSARQIEAHPRLALPVSAKRTPGLKPKDLIGVPWRVALALQDAGWWLRSDIIWAKRSPMPESVTDRPVSAHEHVFLLAKSERYYYDGEAVKEPAVSEHPSGNGYKRAERLTFPETSGVPRGQDEGWQPTDTRNLRNVWHLGPEPFPEAHFATFVTEVPRRSIAAGSSERGCCPNCGAPWRRVIEPEAGYARFLGRDWSGDRALDAIEGRGHFEMPDGTRSQQRQPKRLSEPKEARNAKYVTTGWVPSCGHADIDPVPAVVLDPFAGAATTLMVALRLGRRALGCELNPVYAAMAERRIVGDTGATVTEAQSLPGSAAAQLRLFDGSAA
jgi:DNA modification methylase